jgi:peptidoglycan/LPS O-acetylase OafA/YrhL
VRLYLPSIASLVLAWGVTFIVKRSSQPDLTPWLQEHIGGTGPLNVLVGSSLMGGYKSLNGSLWSLRWEVLFSLLLPVFLIAAAWWMKFSWLKAVGLLAVCVLWPLVTGSLYPNATYILIFGFGVLLAYQREQLKRLALIIPNAGWVAIACLACVLLTLQWILLPFGVGPESLFARMWMSYNTIGAVLLVFCGAFWPAAKRFLEYRWVAALGALSFSLYLVQEPVIVDISWLTHSRLRLWLAVPLESGAALTIAFVFFRLIERPAHRLARVLAKRHRSAGEGMSAATAIAEPVPSANES